MPETYAVWSDLAGDWMTFADTLLVTFTLDEAAAFAHVYRRFAPYHSFRVIRFHSDDGGKEEEVYRTIPLEHNQAAAQAAHSEEN